MMVILIILGAILAGAIFNEFEFAVLGGFLGFLLALISKLSNQVKQLNQQVSFLQQRMDSNGEVKTHLNSKTAPLEKSELELLAERASRKNSQTTKSVFKINQVKEETTEIVKENQTELPPLKTPLSNPQTRVQSKTNVESKPKENDPLSQLFSMVTNFFTQGNVVVRVGVVILFFGVSFLLKYAAENTMVPIEFRLVGVNIGAIGLLVFGWKLKDKKQGYGLILQGAAVGILYLSLFSAFRLYALVPAALAFPLLILFCGLAMTLAVLQNSRALAVLSAAGGFLAPVLISTGSGDHVALFSYFAVLNIAIFGVAWFKSWRLLNLIGFVFTFVIGIAWGVTSYNAADFSTTEPFLILFYFLYTAIAVLFAKKHKAEIKGYVDSTLIFGLPFIAFSLQVVLVENYEYGLAWSAFVLGAFYLLAAYLIVKSKNENLKVIAEAFIALGIIFASLVIPFALDGQWTAATWSIEGAGLIWLGLRQSRWFAKYFGSLIQLVGGFLFIAELDFNSFKEFQIDAQLLGIVFVAISALFSSYQIDLRRSELKLFEANSRYLFLAWGLIWWYIGGFFEISQFVYNNTTTQYLLVFVSVSALLWHYLEGKLPWRAMTNLIWLTLLLNVSLAVAYLTNHQHFFSGVGSVYWLVAIAIFYAILFRQDQKTSTEKMLTRFAPHKLHLISLLLLIGLSLVELNWLVKINQLDKSSWAISLFGLLICGWLMAIVKFNKWPISQYAKTYGLHGLSVLMVGLCFWSVSFNFPNNGSATPLSYIPFLNPLDITQAIALLCLYQAIVYQKNLAADYSQQLVMRVAIGFCFIWLNIILLRSIHAWTDLSYTPQVLFNSSLVQTSLSIFWTLLGLIGSVLATKMASRKLWIAAASLIGIVVLKLFVIDLDNTSSIERIVSFVVVGLLLLIIGYFSPLPPKLIIADDDSDQLVKASADNEKVSRFNNEGERK